MEQNMATAAIMPSAISISLRSEGRPAPHHHTPNHKERRRGQPVLVGDLLRRVSARRGWAGRADGVADVQVVAVMPSAGLCLHA